MRVLQIHNRYKTGLGGEDTVIENERRMLAEAGHEVRLGFVTTGEENVGGTAALARTAMNSMYSREGRRTVRQWVEEFRPDVAHVHNTFPMLSPSVFHELAALGVPSVVTLHNYRLICANALFLRDGKECSQCLGRGPWAGIQHRCYKGSLLGSTVQAGTRLVHERLQTFRSSVDAFIVLSEFARDVFAKAGLPRERMHVKPNFVYAPPPAREGGERKNVFLFIGKVVPEKGVDHLLKAWRTDRPEGWELWIVGDGPSRASLEAEFADLPGVTWHGWKGPAEVAQFAAMARWLVLPSVWYEGFPMVLVEGFAAGTPAIVPKLGAMPEIVAHGVRGLVYGDGATLGDALRFAAVMPAGEEAAIRRACRQAVDGPYSPGANRKRIEEIYEAAMRRVALSGRAR